MRKQISGVLAFALVAALAAPALAERGDDTNRQSKNGRTEATVGGAGVVVEYGRPKVRERAIFGELVPYGQVWRTGADEATTVTLDRDVTVEGQPLAAGTYALFTIPGESEWTVIFNRQAEQWGAYEYDASQDALRVAVAPKEGEHVEELEIAADGPHLVVRWADVVVPVKIETAG